MDDRPSSSSMTRQELQWWLCGDERPSETESSFSSLSSFEHALGLPRATLAESALLLSPHEQLQRRFIVALLRDIFASDGDARRWLASPHVELGDRRPLDLVAVGAIADVETLLVKEWHLAAREAHVCVSGRDEALVTVDIAAIAARS